MIYAVLIWNIFLLSGTAYLVSTGWSAWWFLLAVSLLATVTSKSEEKQNEKASTIHIVSK